MAFTDAEKTELRRFMGYPAYGAGAAGFNGFRFFQAYGTMEFRLNNLSAAEEAKAKEFLATLGTLETAVPGAGANLDTDQAAVWHRNRNEVGDRAALLSQWSRRLCAFLGLPPGPGLSAGGMEIVV